MGGEVLWTSFTSKREFAWAWANDVMRAAGRSTEDHPEEVQQIANTVAANVVHHLSLVADNGGYEEVGQYVVALASRPAADDPDLSKSIDEMYETCIRIVTDVEASKTGYAREAVEAQVIEQFDAQMVDRFQEQRPKLIQGARDGGLFA